MSVGEIAESSAEQWLCDGRERDWVRQWVESCDGSGRPVQRGYGLAAGAAGDFIVHNNQGPSGNQQGSFFFADWAAGKPSRLPAPDGWTGAAGSDLPVTDARLLSKVAIGPPDV